MVYIVDDDAAVRDSLQLLLDAHGMAAAAFASTEEFAVLVRPQKGACLIIDQNLAGATGLDFVEGGAPGMPVILITGQGSAAIRAKAEKLGVAAYFEKPVDADALIAAIEAATR
jgi:two-component system, LuxR family, response regulator FixJ